MMDPRQDPEMLELFKSGLARRLFDDSVSTWQLECDRAVIDLVEQGFVLVQKTDRGWECQLTEAGESFT
jgi:hypothetical protein